MSKDTTRDIWPNRNDLVLMIIDIQEKLFLTMENKERIIRSNKILIQVAKLLNIPILVTEQYPDGLGPTIFQLIDILSGIETIEKIHFSSLKCEECEKQLSDLGKKTVVITGIEAHICVLQTVLDLLSSGYKVFVPRDAVSSRKSDDMEAALQLMSRAGAIITTTEALVYLLLRRAGTEEFRKISKLIK